MWPPRHLPDHNRLHRLVTALKWERDILRSRDHLPGPLWERWDAIVERISSYAEMACKEGGVPRQ
jgi:hypothetical protein